MNIVSVLLFTFGMCMGLLGSFLYSSFNTIFSLFLPILVIAGIFLTLLFFIFLDSTEGSIKGMAVYIFVYLFGNIALGYALILGVLLLAGKL